MTKNRFIIWVIMFLASTTVAQDTSKINPLKIQLGFGGAYTDGNAKILGFNTSNSITHTTLNREWSITPSFIYSQVQQDNVFKPRQRELYITGAVQEKRKIDKVFSAFELETSLVKQILARTSIGLGWSFDLIRSDKTKFIISEAAVYESYESEVILIRNLQSLRASTRIKFSSKGPIDIDLIALIQPSIWNDQGVSLANNTNSRISATFSIPITKKLQFGITSTFIGSTYSSFLNSNISPIDVNTTLNLIYKNL